MNLRRRSFLRWTALAGVASISGWRFALQSEAGLLATLYTDITGDIDSSAAIEFMNSFIARLSARDRLELRAGLTLLEQSPFAFHGFLPRYTQLDPARRRVVLEGWRDGALWRRPLFGAVKDLSYLAYYRRPETWAAIGYSGPMVPESREATDRDREYLALVEGGGK